MSKLSNTLLMLQLLQNGRKYSSKELSEKLEVSIRMIRKYKEELECAGIFIDTIKGPYGGYVLNKNFNIPYLNFNENDVSFINKISLLINDSKIREELLDIKSKMTLNIENGKNNKKVIISDNSELNIFNKINNAYKNNLKLKINYYNLKHGNSIRTIYPLGLYLFENEWWVSAYWEEKDDMRQFHLKRIVDCEILDSKFNPSEINIKF